MLCTHNAVIFGTNFVNTSVRIPRLRLVVMCILRPIVILITNGVIANRYGQPVTVGVTSQPASQPRHGSSIVVSGAMALCRRIMCGGCNIYPIHPPCLTGYGVIGGAIVLIPIQWGCRHYLPLSEIRALMPARNPAISVNLMWTVYKRALPTTVATGEINVTTPGYCLPGMASTLTVAP